MTIINGHVQRCFAVEPHRWEDSTVVKQEKIMHGLEKNAMWDAFELRTSYSDSPR